ncbi:MAG: NAD(P)-binding domain-containing protein [Treponema sp.]|jgi:pyrroline-5-carboxylate reductase|nr:NAD(P)-binding domain-containing protein [Treponema sp.]
MKIDIIGYGSMGKMILEKFIETKTIEQGKLFVSNRTYDKIMNLNKIYPQINICGNNIDAVKDADIVFICVKPLEIKTVLSEIINGIKDNCHIVSLNGSILFKQLEQICGNRKISKIIPSVTAEVNKSATLICHNDYVNYDDKNILKELIGCFGSFVELPETEIGIGSELTSCMPGFIGAIFKVITDEAEKHTAINKEQIIQMVIETLYGTGKLLLEKRITFEELINRVATKGGITEEGTEIIGKKLPEIINEVFEKTLEKRKIITEKAQKDFMI